ncbi:MAG: Crp/Fnr family transcriptional regulator [Dehalococcoidia bacterium]|nr:Crp/Fnr family transcriptional regulator [Dehalococcoidia bacterium]
MDENTAPRENRLLASLAEADLHALRSSLRPVTLDSGTTLFEQDERIDQLVFPLTAAVSLLTVLESGDAHEHVMVGRTGMVGFSALLEDGRSPFRALVQVPGQALVLPRADFHSAAADGLRQLAARYSIMLLRLAGQAAACSANHRVEERVARSLLRLEDLTGRDAIPITQEFIALLLGVQRQTVTLAAGRLQRAGLVQYSRGRIVIVDRDGLEGASCECYLTMRRAEDRLFD